MAAPAYSKTVSAGGASTLNCAAPSDCSWPLRTVTLRIDGGFVTWPKIELPSGRSKYIPTPPRDDHRLSARDVIGRAEPRSEPSAGHVYVVSAMPWPDCIRPFVRLPVLATSVPIATVELGPRNWPVTGFFACRFVPVQVVAPFAQPAM